MKKILFLAAIFSILNSQLSIPRAQRIHALLGGGVTLSQIEGDELKGFTKWGLTAGVGAIAGFDRHETWNLSIEALFSQRGCYNATGDPYNVSIRLDYIEIPLLVRWRDPWGGMLVGAGLCYGRLVQQPHGIVAYNSAYFIPDSTDLSFLPSDLSAVFDITFPVWYKLMMNIRWQHSLLAVKRDWHFTEYHGVDAAGNPLPKTWANNCYNHSLTFRLIWQF